MTVSDPTSAVTLLQQAVFNKLKLALGITADPQWTSFINSDHSGALSEFLSSSSPSSLVFYVTDGVLFASSQPRFEQPSHPSRCVFFLNTTSQKLSPENFNEILMSGETTGGNVPRILSMLKGQAGLKAATPRSFSPNQSSSLLSGLNYAALEQYLSSSNNVLDRTLLLQLENAASTLVSLVDAAVARPAQSERPQMQNQPNNGGAAAAEVGYWNTRASSLAELNRQFGLYTFPIVQEALVKSGSAAGQRAQQACDNAAAASKEAAAVASSLRRVRPLLVSLSSSDDLLSAADAVTLCMHGLLLTWQITPAFRSQSILSPIIQAIADDVVEVARRCVYGSELLNGDLNEAADKVRAMLRMLGHAKSCYADARAKSAASGATWGGAGSVFQAIDALMARCQEVHTVASTATQYSKLERIDLGGPEGAALTASARQLHAEFAAAQEKLTSAGVDPFNISDTQSTFPAAIATWRQVVNQLDARLAILVSQALAVAPTLEAASRITDSLESLAERSAVQRQLEKVQLQAVKSFTQEVRTVGELFECEKASPPPLTVGAPPCAGAVAWVRGLQERLTVPMARLKTLPKGVLESDAGREMTRLYQNMLSMLRSHEDKIMAQWCEESAGISDATMRQPVLVFSPARAGAESSGLQVNFDPALSMLLKEVRALTAMPRLLRPIPAPAMAFFQREAALLQNISALRQLTTEVNSVRASLLGVEAPLVASALAGAESAASKGQKGITWAAADLDTYASSARDCGKELSKAVKALREAVACAEAEALRWLKEFPLGETALTSIRRAASPLQSFVEFHSWLGTTIDQRKRAVIEGATRLTAQLTAAATVLQVDPESPPWAAFRIHVATIARKGLQDAIVASLQGFAALLSAQQISFPPLLTVSLKLDGSDGLEWSPTLGEWRKQLRGALNVKGLPRTVAEAVEVYACTLADLKLPDLPTAPDETMDQKNDGKKAIEEALNAVKSAFMASVVRCDGQTSQFSKFDALWKAPEKGLLSSLAFSSDLDLPLAEIEAEVQKLRTFQAEILALPSTQGCGWVAVDLEPAKQALAAAAGKRVAALTEAIKSKVENKLNDIAGFVQSATETIQAVPGVGGPGKEGSTSSSPAARAAGTAGSPSPAASRRVTTVAPSGTGHRSSILSRPSIMGSRASISGRRVSTLSTTSTATGGVSKTPRRSSLAALGIDRTELYSALRSFKDVAQRVAGAEAELAPLLEASTVLQRCGAPLAEETAAKLAEVPQKWRTLTRRVSAAKEALAPAIAAETADVQRRAADLVHQSEEFRAFFQKTAPFGVTPNLNGDKELSQKAVEQAFAALDMLFMGGFEGSAIEQNLQELTMRGTALRDRFALLTTGAQQSPADPAAATLQRCHEDIAALRLVWQEAAATLDLISSWDAMPWAQMDADALGEQCKAKSKDLRALPRTVREYEIYKILEAKVKGVASVLPLIKDLAHPAMKDRHWGALGRTLHTNLPSDPASLTLGALLALHLDRCADACAEVVDSAKREAVVEKALLKMEAGWKVLTLQFVPAAGTNTTAAAVPTLVVDAAVTEALESDGVTLQNLSASKAVMGNPTFRTEVGIWQRRLNQAEVTLAVWTDTQRKWSALEAIFCGSADIRARLPEDAAAFDQVNENFKELMAVAPAVPGVLDACAVPGRKERLEALLRSLELRERALQDYLETKRQAFPRFYFVSTADLLDILAKGTDLHAVERHLPKLFDNLHRLEWKKDSDGRPTHMAIGMYSGEGEYVPFDGECECSGAAEVWLGKVVDAMRAALRAEYHAAMSAYEERPRVKWVFDYSAQTTVIVSRTYFTQEVNDAFAELEAGNEDALKAVLERQKAQLSDLIGLINGPLSKNDRKKLITLCTIDVHARDVVARMIEDRCESADAFAWQSQLRYGRDPKTGDPLVQICDADIPYQFEYIGNCGCLCITPLTDRCYITLTQAQRLILGGAPAGPAGTGKTETTKDLARALGVQCYVFNCSDQMDYKAMGQIYKGLAQTGAWGCFDEFNRIPVPVLSVCSTQYKTVLDALRAKQKRFLFEGTEINLRSSAMAHITMNPGYIGRAELPESLKALFRPVSMAAPDLALICEIMLMAEGFQAAKSLSRKFIALYRLCEDLLSKARHYDWKLRAIKTTLYVAGGMKRAAPDLSEEKVLLRALRDFNLGKLTADDAVVFSGLLEDLFPKASGQVPRAIDITFETRVREAALELGYQPDPAFLLKVSQLREIFEVRWSVFLLGPPGCGKTAVWRTLQRALQLSGHKAVANVINPKSVTRDELYGCLHPQTREWKEGLLSATFRSMATAHTSGGAATAIGHHQWIVLDGDIDPEWIESMNTVMDDNKMLTLASNERIPLAPSMRLLLEISHMNHASPATVSRGGVIYMNAEDVGWRTAADSWLARRSSLELRSTLAPLFDKYFEPAVEFIHKKCTTVVPLPAVNQVETLCKLLEGLLPEEPAPGASNATPSPPLDRKLAEGRFVFACVWAVGGCLPVDKLTDHRAVFSKWWTTEDKAVPFPAEGTVFDYYIDANTGSWAPWIRLVPKFNFAEAMAEAAAGTHLGAPLDPAALFVPTVETVRMQYLMKLLLENGHSAMLVGPAGTGKTAAIKDLLRSLNPETYAAHVLPLNSFHDGPTLQAALEAPLERKTGARFGPPGTKKLIYFVDDANMPGKDKYDTQSALELLRQAIDSKGWYDKTKATPKEIAGIQFLAAMNPASGSFTISGRLQRHFATFFVPPPPQDTAISMFSELVQGHLASPEWSEEVRKLGPVLVEATVDLHKAVLHTFIPSAVRFHYVFTLREVAAVIGGLLRMTPSAFGSKPLKAARLWAHECERVYADRLTSDADLATFEKLKGAAARRHLVTRGIQLAALDARPLLFTTFCSGNAANTNGGEGDNMGAAAMDVDDVTLANYDEVSSGEHLRRVLEARLVEHNESNPAAAMDLVLFPQATEQVVRLSRVLAVPGGHVAVIGVGGSGKQSLSRLAAHVGGCEVFQIQVTAGYGVTEFRADLLTLYQKCGAKSAKIAFILTDSHLVDDRFLVYVNELLATGQVADLVGPEEKDALGAAVRAEVKAAGGQDTPEACWAHVLKKVRRNLHVVLCLSPAGERLRGLARRFPALVSCVTYNWLRPWPRDALESVAERFLVPEPLLAGESNAELRAAVAAHMASAHEAVEGACRQYLEQYRRYNYTTPKSFLELIGLYKQTLQKTSAGLAASRERLERGVEKISSAAAAVEGLRTALAAEKLVVEEKKAAAAALIESIGREKAIADEAVASSKGDEEAAAVLAAQVSQVQTECASNLAVAEPIIAAAEAALNSLDKASLGELKSFSNPAPEVVAVVAACMVLTAPGGAIPKELTWAAGKKWMGAQSLDSFLKSLLNFNKDNVPAACVERVERDYLSIPTFKAEVIKVKSVAAAGLCAWVVAPKRAALAEANRKLADANRRLAAIRSRIAELRARVAALEASLISATAEKVAAEAQAERTARKAALADRVIGGLGSEFQRWSASIEDIKKKEETVVGDALIAAAFVSYAGAFNSQLRAHLVDGCWVPEAQRRGIPLSTSPSPMQILSTPTSQATWDKEGLPRDRLSGENAGIVGATRRWPLLIDPQLHGSRWVLGREKPNGLVVLQQGAPKLIDTVIRCVENGTPLLIENLPETLNPALEPLIARRTVKRGRSVVVTLAGREVTLHPEFRLYLHTKLPNPHYGPEVAAQTTLVNFAVTPEGLEEQLLAAVVGHEAADLQAQAAALARQLAEYTVTLQQLEDGLLAKLAASQGDILEDKPLVDSLEATKATAAEVAANVKKAKAAEVQLSAACEVYRPVAARGALLYFFIDSLPALDRVYWFSMANFTRVLQRGMDAAPRVQQLGEGQNPDLSARVEALVATVTETIYFYVSQGLFERHKPVAAAQLALATLRARSLLPPAALDFLLRAPQLHGKENPVSEWLPNSAWATVLALEQVENFQGLCEDLVGGAKRWREWVSLERPEDEFLPGDWKKLKPLQKLLVVRALRPDRVGPALSSFVTAVLEPSFVASKTFDLEAALHDAGPATPILIFVSPGVDAAASVEALARKKGLVGAGRYASVSLGQGQEAPAMARLRHAAANGGWVLLQNIHLTMEWTWVELDRAIDGLPGGTTHPDFQLFLSAEPPPSLERPLPPSLLQSCVKLTNEPPQGLRANLARAWAQFDDDAIDSCARQTEYRAIVFALCFFHAVLQERKKFGVGNAPGARSGIGWNMSYPFSAGDLRCCAQLAGNYLDSGAKIPWEDLRYLVGDIMYGGHVVEAWDRRLVGAYLETLLSPGLLENGKVCPGLSLPPPGLNHAQTAKYIEENAPKEGGAPLGLHSNAERGVALRAAGELCASLAALQTGAGTGAGSGGGSTVEERCRAAMDMVLETLPAQINIEELRVAAATSSNDTSAPTSAGGASNTTAASSTGPGPYLMVVLQECERMNVVLVEIRSSLAELALGLKGDFVMSEALDALAGALAADRVPSTWAAISFPSLRPLSSWIKNLAARHTQLAEWASTPAALPNSAWLPGLFNPASFLTAVQQVAARKAGWALDATALVTEVTRKSLDQIDSPPREGAYIHGLWLEGARWDGRGGCLEESKPKEMACMLPVLHVRGVPADKAAPPPDAYACPVYTTEARFRQEVFTVHLKGGKAPAAKWAAAGVALLLDIA